MLSRAGPAFRRPRPHVLLGLVAMGSQGWLAPNLNMANLNGNLNLNMPKLNLNVLQCLEWPQLCSPSASARR